MKLKLFNSKFIKIMIGVIWGLGLACIFRKTCEGRKCIVYRAPDPNEIQKNIYSYNDKCYKYKTKPTECTKDAYDSM